MRDLRLQREKLRLNAADCDLIASLATEPKKREIFEHLGAQLRRLVADIDAEIEKCEARGSASDRAYGMLQENGLGNAKDLVATKPFADSA